MFERFCRSLAYREEPAAKNMMELRELLDVRFDGNKGQMYVIYDGLHIVGCSGCYISDFSPKVGILGTRSWLEPKYRVRQVIRNMVLPDQRDWMIEKGMKQIALTFNEYNRNLIHLFERQIVKRAPRSPRHMFHLNMNKVEHKVMIQYTPQWVLYESLDPAWSFDWSTLKDVPDLSE
jgi:hypothetical protein